MMRETKSTCPYCGVGCGVVIQSEGDAIVGVRGDETHPANYGKLCSKGSTLHLTARPELTQLRARYPQWRKQRGGAWERSNWGSTFSQLSQRFADIILQHGPDAVGFYISGQLLTEDYYVFNKLAKGLIGTNNIDTNSRLCMSSAVAGYKQSLGADAPPCSYEDIAKAQVIFIAGSNAAIAHPILFRRIEEAKRNNPALKIIVADPRRTETAEFADLFLQIEPGTDVALFNGMLHVMFWEGLCNQRYIAAHTLGCDQIKQMVQSYTPEMVSQICGIKVNDLVQAARWFAQSEATLSLYCQGLNQSSSGTAKNSALINLHLATGQIGKPGAGPFSLTGQPNAMGGREVGGLANQLSAHRDMSNAAHRTEVAALWGVADVPAAPGKTAIEMFRAAAEGEIKALWIACTNPAQSLPDQALVRQALQRCELVVLQECYAHTETAKYADVILPASTWGEKEGTVTNSERRISRVRGAVPAPGEAMHDWQIVTQFANALECRLAQRGTLATKPLFPYETAEHIWNEHRESTRGRDLDITGLSYAKLEAQPEQWPYPEGATTAKSRLYEDGLYPTPEGKSHFVTTRYSPVAEPRDARYPFALNTGRLRDQWHGMSRTGTVAQLFGHTPEPLLQMNAQDMARLQLAAGDLVHLTSRRGSQIVAVEASDAQAPNQVFLPMHWGEAFLGGRETHGVNGVTQPAVCPQSKQPELKHSAVKVLKAELPWRLAAMAVLPERDAQLALTRLREQMPLFDHCVCVPFDVPANRNTHTGIMLIASNYHCLDDATIDSIEEILQLDSSDVMRYVDKRRAQRRVIQLAGDALTGYLLAGDASAQAWLKPLLKQGSGAAALGRYLMMPTSKLPAELMQQFSSMNFALSKQVCQCFNVSEHTINTALSQLSPSLNGDAQLEQLKTGLRCGTNCGSCLPEIKRLIRLRTPAAAAEAVAETA